jgi:fatty-acyl-CoA synthase
VRGARRDIFLHRVTDVDIARSHHLGDLLRRSAQRYPAKTAVVDGAVRQSFAEFDATVNRTANALADRGVLGCDRVALFAHNSHGFVVTALACARLGAVTVPVNFMLGVDEVAFVVGHAGVVGFVAEDRLVAVAVAAIDHAQAGATVRVRGIISEGRTDGPGGWESVHDWMAHPDSSEPSIRVEDDHPVFLSYTSGTESRPKGATLTSRSLISQFVSCIVDAEMSPEDIEIHAMPLFHCAQLFCFLLPDLYLGATSIILPSADAGEILRAIEDERATKLFCPPTVWITLMAHPDFQTRGLSSLRTGFYGASAMPVEVLHELSRRLPNVRLFNFYGQTEMSPLATLLRPEDQLRKAGSAGRPCLNVQTRIHDDQDRPVGAGVVGEIVHRSPHAMAGYWNDPEKTIEAFRNGWFHSGDLGFVDEEGYLSVVDRKKDMIKTGGENVASREVEEAIYGHEAVLEVAVFGVADPKWIEAVAAAVVVRDGIDLTAEDVIAHCRNSLARFKVPKHVVIVDGLPKNPSGKILKRDLRERFATLATRPV